MEIRKVEDAKLETARKAIDELDRIEKERVEREKERDRVKKK